MKSVTKNTRRDFLKTAGFTTIALTSSGLLSNILSGCATVRPNKKFNPNIPFIQPTSADDVILSPGLEYQNVISWKDPINSKEFFGICNDFIAYIPLHKKSDEALVWVNHESPVPYLIHGEKDPSKKTKEQVIQEQHSVGGSILQIKRTSGPDSKWELVKNSKYNRRLDAQTEIPFAGNATVFGKKSATGTFANCSGGVTAWNTILSCEENYSDFCGEVNYQNKNRTITDTSIYGWNRHFEYAPEHYGWVLEVDPFTGRAKKHTSMGRFEHECAKTIIAKNGKTVVYLADDCENEHLYKFISDRPHSLEKGTLYVAHLESGTWIPLSIENPKLKGQFKDLTDLLIQTRKAAKLVGATPIHRPEDIEILNDKTVLVACTNSAKRKDPHGYILALEEESKDPLSLKFNSYKWLDCGPDAGLSCPDNFVLDNKGNLWVASDISEKQMGRYPYNERKNNGLFYIPTSGEDKGVVYQVASCPFDGEFTGPCFSSDFKTLFLSVQHPGMSSNKEKGYTSSWPDGKGKVPRSTVIAITGPLLDRLNFSDNISDLHNNPKKS